MPIQTFSQVNGAKPRTIIDINSPQRLPDRYIVTYVESQNKNNFKASIQEITQEIAATSNSQILKIYDSALIGSALYNTNQSSIELLYTNPNVHKIYADLNVTLATTQVDPPLGLDRVDQANFPLDSSYEYSLDGTGVDVYVIGTGVLASHDEFSGRVLTTVDVSNDLGNPLYENKDTINHDTAVAAVIGGNLSPDR